MLQNPQKSSTSKGGQGQAQGKRVKEEKEIKYRVGLFLLTGTNTNKNAHKCLLQMATNHEVVMFCFLSTTDAKLHTFECSLLKSFVTKPQRAMNMCLFIVASKTQIILQKGATRRN